MTSRVFVTGSIYLLLFVSMSSCKEEKSKKTNFELLPAPRKIELREGIVIKPEKFKTIYLYAKADENDRFAANLLKDELDKLFNFSARLQVVESYENISGPAIILGIPSEDPQFSDFSKRLPAPQKDNEEAYIMDVNKKSIIISGGGKAGLFYGVQTLIQLMEEAKWDNGSLQGLLIQDWPQIKLRAVHYNFFSISTGTNILKNVYKNLPDIR